MLPRFLADSFDHAASTAQLGADEARHLSQVMRLGPGDAVAVFDGAGREFRAQVVRVTRDGAALQLVEEIAAAPESAVPLTLVQAVLKGEKMDDVVRDATMMGVAAIQPLITEHTAAHVRPGAAPPRWARIAISSAKQCRRAVVPRVASAVHFRDWLATDHSTLKILLTEPSAAAAGKMDLSPFPPPKMDLSPFSAAKRGQVHFSAALIVGPEGGWSPAEVDAAVAAGCETLTLGRRTLRADAVALIAIALLQYSWGEL